MVPLPGHEDPVLLALPKLHAEGPRPFSTPVLRLHVTPGKGSGRVVRHVGGEVFELLDHEVLGLAPAPGPAGTARPARAGPTSPRSTCRAGAPWPARPAGPAVRRRGRPPSWHPGSRETSGACSAGGPACPPPSGRWRRCGSRSGSRAQTRTRLRWFARPCWSPAAQTDAWLRSRFRRLWVWAGVRVCPSISTVRRPERLR